MPAVQQRDVLTVDEIRDALGAFSEADLVRLRNKAAYYCGGTGFEAKDLFQEAMRRSLEENGRKCPRDVDPAIFLGNVMRSIGSAEREKWTRESPIGETNGGIDLITQEPDPAPDPERVTIGLDSLQHTVDLIEELFTDDPEALAIVMGDMDECSPGEICELQPMTDKEYAAARRRVRRAFQKSFPEGTDHDR